MGHDKSPDQLYDVQNLNEDKLIYYDSNFLWLRHHSLKNDRKIIARSFVNTNSLAFFNSA